MTLLFIVLLTCIYIPFVHYVLIMYLGPLCHSFADVGCDAHFAVCYVLSCCFLHFTLDKQLHKKNSRKFLQLNIGMVLVLDDILECDEC